MNCPHCKGIVEKGSVPFSADRNGYHISWDSMSAWVCTQCGESLFEENEVKHIHSRLQQSVPSAVKLHFSGSGFTVDLEDGRSISIPLVWFPRLFHASESELNHWRLIGRGSGIHWEDIDEDISIESIVSDKQSSESQQSLKKWLGSST